MQRIPVAIPAVQLATSAAAVYTAPVGTKSTISNLVLTNTSTAVVTVTLYRVASAGAPGAANTIMSAFALVPGQSLVPPQVIGLTLEAGMTLQALASAATSITLAGAAYETSGS
jgi:hypothetical protein